MVRHRGTLDSLMKSDILTSRAGSWDKQCTVNHQSLCTGANSYFSWSDVGGL